MPWLLPSLDLQLSAPVTFLVGENGTGKSTLLEAIAWSLGFGAQGRNRDQSIAGNADGYIATHSPMLLTFPGATIFSLDAGQIRQVTYQETDHFRITRDFLNAPDRYYRHLLEEGDEINPRRR